MCNVLFESKSNTVERFAETDDVSSIATLFVLLVINLLVDFGTATNPAPEESIFCIKLASVLTVKLTFSSALTSAPFLNSISLV